MHQNRTVRSTAPSPSSPRSITSTFSIPSSPILFLPKATLRTVATPRIAQPPSPNAHLTHHSQPCASATHTPPLPLMFLWRCCRSDCRTSNTHFTTTHFTRLHHVRGRLERWTWAPSYRKDSCQECNHAACETCLLLQVEGHSEWKGAEVESEFGQTGDVGVWRRIGFWDEGRRFGGTDGQSKVGYDDVVRDLESDERVDLDRDIETFRSRQK